MDEVQEMKVEPKPVKMESSSDSTKIENTSKGTEILLSVFNIYVDIL